MHSYATDGKRGRFISLIIAVAAILLAWALGAVFARFEFDPPWWLDTPAVIGFYGILWNLYDSFIWKIGGRQLNVSGLVNVSGTWIGELHSSYGGGTVVAAKLQVRQSATRIQIVLETESSSSESIMAMVRTEQGGRECLLYDYRNEPRALTAPTMGVHRGQVRLSLLDNPVRLEGDYSTNASRGNEGRMTFRLM